MSRMPQVQARELIAFLKKQGFVEDRQAGSHLTLWNDDRQVAVTIPVHSSCSLGRGLAIRILKDAGFTVDEFVNR